MAQHAPRSMLARYVWWNLLLPSRGWGTPPERGGATGRVIFVCSGNLCRSPYAEARARAAGLDAVSYGLAAGTGDHSPVVAVRVAARRGLSLVEHRSRPLVAGAVGPRDLILVMEPGMGRRCRSIPGVAPAHVALLGMYSGRGSATPYIPDPFGLTEEVFDLSFALIDRCIERLVDRLAATEPTTGPRVSPEPQRAIDRRLR